MMKRFTSFIIAFALFFYAPLNLALGVTGFVGAKATGVPILCTCPAGIPGSLGVPPPPGFLWMLFAKIHLKPVNRSFVPIPVGALVYPPAITYATYEILPGAWILGKYYPPPSAAGCGIYVELVYVRFCIPLPNYGMVVPFTGASLPGPV